MDSDAKGTENLEVGRMFRIFRVLRVYRLVRLQKLRRLWFTFKDQVQSELVFLVPVLVQMFLSLFIITHVLGSLWYLIGAIGRGLGWENWIQTSDITEQSVEYRYLASMSWALHVFTLSSSIIEPQNGFEGTFAIAVNFLGVALFLVSIATITNSFTELRGLQGETIKEFWLLRRFLRQRKVDQDLQFRIIHYAEAQSKAQIEMLPENKVHLLAFLPHNLKGELDFNLSYSKLFNHPLMVRLHGKAHILQELTYTALSKEMFA